MSLSKSQKADIVFFLGHPGKTLLEGSTDYSKIFSDKLKNLGTQVEDQTLNLIAKIKDIDSRLEEAAGHFAAKKVGDIELNDGERGLLIAERKRYIKLLAGILDIEVLGGGSGVMFGVTV